MKESVAVLTRAAGELLWWGRWDPVGSLGTEDAAAGVCCPCAHSHVQLHPCRGRKKERRAIELSLLGTRDCILQVKITDY